MKKASKSKASSSQMPGSYRAPTPKAPPSFYAGPAAVPSPVTAHQSPTSPAESEVKAEEWEARKSAAKSEVAEMQNQI